MPGLPIGNYYGSLGNKYAYFYAAHCVNENPGSVVVVSHSPNDVPTHPTPLPHIHSHGTGCLASVQRGMDLIGSHNICLQEDKRKKYPETISIFPSYVIVNEYPSMFFCHVFKEGQLGCLSVCLGSKTLPKEFRL